eukprot:Hpha_TRINITY_DN14377_c0_g1::TRINITY_DN14377_c0_g1_i1::g.86889::m.86889
MEASSLGTPRPSRYGSEPWRSPQRWRGEEVPPLGRPVESVEVAEKEWRAVVQCAEFEARRRLVRLAQALHLVAEENTGRARIVAAQSRFLSRESRGIDQPPRWRDPGFEQWLRLRQRTPQRQRSFPVSQEEPPQVRGVARGAARRRSHSCDSHGSHARSDVQLHGHHGHGQPPPPLYVRRHSSTVILPCGCWDARRTPHMAVCAALVVISAATRATERVRNRQRSPWRPPGTLSPSRSCSPSACDASPSRSDRERPSVPAYIRLSEPKRNCADQPQAQRASFSGRRAKQPPPEPPLRSARRRSASHTPPPSPPEAPPPPPAEYTPPPLPLPLPSPGGTPPSLPLSLPSPGSTPPLHQLRRATLPLRDKEAYERQKLTGAEASHRRALGRERQAAVLRVPSKPPKLQRAAEAPLPSPRTARRCAALQESTIRSHIIGCEAAARREVIVESRARTSPRGVMWPGPLMSPRGALARQQSSPAASPRTARSGAWPESLRMLTPRTGTEEGRSHKSPRRPGRPGQSAQGSSLPPSPHSTGGRAA